jgi:hypothetical protein
MRERDNIVLSKKNVLRFMLKAIFLLTFLSWHCSGSAVFITEQSSEKRTIMQ